MAGGRRPDLGQPLHAAPARFVRSERAAPYASHPDQGRLTFPSSPRRGGAKRRGGSSTGTMRRRLRRHASSQHSGEERATAGTEVAANSGRELSLGFFSAQKAGKTEVSAAT